MKTFRVVLAAAVLAAVVGACGSDPRTEVEQTFKGYYTALLARDFTAACAVNAPESTDKLLASVATQGIRVTTCEEAFAAIFEQPGAADTADAVARSVKVDDIAVDGDEATITWTATLDGAPRTATNGLRRVDGGWKLVAAS